MPQPQPGHHHSEYAGDVELLGEQVRGVGGGQRQRVLGERIVQALADPTHHSGDGQPGGEPTGGGEQKLTDRAAHREAAADRRRHRDLQGRQRGRVVEQALPFDQGDQPRRQTGAAADR